MTTSYPKSSATRSRRLILALLIFISLFLVGTIVVLSSISFYLAIPTSAFLTEEEVPWQPEGVIRAFKNVSSSTVTGLRRIPSEKRNGGGKMATADSAEGMADESDGIMGEDTIAHIWEELEDEGIATTKSSSTPTDSTATSTTSPQDEEEDTDYLDSIYGSGVEPSTKPAGSGGSIDETEEMDNEEEDVVGWDDVAEGGTGGDEGNTWDEWGVDGKGSGGYWMKAGWNGRVEGADNWDRLFNVTARHGEKIPRLIHQTWKMNHLPEKWQKSWKECREGMPDYEYMLWTDALSREFIAKYYPAQLSTFDNYKYPIQRADAIRYFILHKFGGIYMDLDIGCRRRLEPLLCGDWEVILPITKPIGISNDLIFSAKGSEFMAQTVEGLKAFDDEYVINYPTVMFSTGYVFSSVTRAFAERYQADVPVGTILDVLLSHPLSSTSGRAQVRILPKSLYGKNAPAESVPHSFFSHFYGSSWHADDAGFIGFLGNWGTKLMYLGGILVVSIGGRLIWLRIGGGKGERDYQLLPVGSAGQTPTTPSWTVTDTSDTGLLSRTKNFGNLLLSEGDGEGRGITRVFKTSSPRGRRARRSPTLAIRPTLLLPLPEDPLLSRSGIRSGSSTATTSQPIYETESSEHTIRASSFGMKKIADKGMEEVDEFLKMAGRQSGESDDAIWEWKEDQ